MYSPTLGRFLQTDPIGTNGGVNLYGYVGNDPLNAIDPDGLAASLVAGGLSKLLSCPSSCLANEGEGGLASASDALSLAKNDPGTTLQIAAMAIPSAAEVEGGLLAAEEAPLLARSAYQLRVEGETAVRSAFNIGDKVPIDLGGRTIIPDGLNATNLSEVKNVGSLSFTNQLRTYSDFAQQNGFRFGLYTRSGTTFSGPLQNAIESGMINRLDIP